MVTSFPKKNLSRGVLRHLEEGSFPGKGHGMSFSCVYFSCMLGIGLDQKAVDVQSLLLVMPEEGREQANVQPRQNEAIEEMSSQG